MTAAPWSLLGPVQAGADSIDIHRQSGFVFRIWTADGEIVAPAWPTHMRAGHLMRRAAVACVAPGVGVQTHPMSATPKPMRR